MITNWLSPEKKNESCLLLIQALSPSQLIKAGVWVRGVSNQSIANLYLI